LQDGNCLFSSISIALVGNSSLCSILRALSCLELYLHSKFYSNHPFFHKVVESNPELFSSIKSILCLSVSDHTFNMEGSEFVKKAADYMCHDKIWGSLMCILALATVVNSNISINYPDFGPIKYMVLFNQTIFPRHQYDNENNGDLIREIKILFCNLQPTSNSDFFANHYVPLIKRKIQSKSIQNLKRVIAISEKLSPKPKQVKVTPSLEALSLKFPKLHTFYPSIPKSLSKSHSSVVTSNSFLVSQTTSTLTTSMSNRNSSTLTKGTPKTVFSLSSANRKILDSFKFSSSQCKGTSSLTASHPPPPPLPLLFLSLSSLPAV